MDFKKNWIYPLLVSLTLGLAPFWPEPHIWKQLVALSHGNIHEFIDWFDLVLHGFPWIWLIIVLIVNFREKTGAGKA